MKMQSSSPSDLVDLAENLRLEGRSREALEALERCLQESPKHPRALLLRGRLLYQEGSIPKALEGLRPLNSILDRDSGLKTITTGLEQLWDIRNSQMDPAFVTETMARLLVQQGYLLEAIEIYRQLLLTSEEKKRIWEEILLLRDRLEGEGSRGMERERVVQELEALDHWIQKQQREF
jgi:tetratricopeptide (TPR) repeat protein